MQSTLKIGLLGPESTGKSTIGALLAERFGGIYIKEHARTYVQEHPQYTYADVCHIAEVNRREWEQAVGLTFFDTDLIITRVWLDEVYHHHEPWLDVNPCPMDFYLLLAPDLPWETDPTRENGNQAIREYLFNQYLSHIQATGKPYCIIRGLGEERFLAAVEAVSSYLSTAK